MTPHRPRPLPSPRHLVALAGAAVLAASGCAVASDIATGQVTRTFKDRAELEDAPAWVPKDATRITRVNLVENTSSVSVLLASDDGLNDDTCVSRKRLSGPTVTIDGAPDVYLTVHDVLLCGDWAVIPTDTGWYGWTPAPEGHTAW